MPNRRPQCQAELQQPSTLVRLQEDPFLGHAFPKQFILGFEELNLLPKASSVDRASRNNSGWKISRIGAKTVENQAENQSWALSGFFVSGEQGMLVAGEFRHAVLEQDGEVVQGLLPVPNRHRPMLRSLADRHKISFSADASFG